MTNNVTDRNESNDLIITRVMKAPRKALWRAWTESELLKEWWCPKHGQPKF